MRRWLRPIAVFFLTVAVGYGAVLAPTWYDLGELDIAETVLKDRYLDRKRMAVNLDIHRRQLRDAEAELAALRARLPDRIDRGFAAVRSAAARYGVRIDYLGAYPRERVGDFYSEQTAALRVSGRYHDLGRFAAAVAEGPGCPLLQRVSLEAVPGQRVSMSAVLRVFRNGGKQ